ncbi:MAG: PKD domain-containing protein [Bacteroidia bacterium]
MKTITQKNKTKKLMQMLVLALGIFCINAAYACSVSITNVNYGVNGHVSFTAAYSDSSAGVTEIIWNAGDGSGNQLYYYTSFSHIYTVNGTYKVSISLTDSSLCSSSDTVTINITNVTVPCTLNANFSYSEGAGGVVTFTSTSAGTYSGTQYYWNPGDGSPQVQGTSTFTHTYTYQGNFYVTLAIEDTGTAYCYSSTQQYIDVTTADSNACHLKANFNYSIGPNGHVTFTNTSTDINQYYELESNWNFGDGGTASTYDTSYNYIYTANGTYTVTLNAFISDSGSCTDTISEVINITNVTMPCELSANFNVVTDSIPAGGAQFTSTSSDTNSGTQYYWKLSDSAAAVKGGSVFNANYASNGTYNAWLIIRDTGASYCIDSISEVVNIVNKDSLHASFISAFLGDTIPTAYQYMYTSTSTGVNDITMYAWQPGDSTAGDTGMNMTTYTHFYKYPGTHTVTLSIWYTVSHAPDKHGEVKQYDLSTYKMKVDIGAPTGITAINNTNADFKLYPNPNNGSFRLAVNGLEGSQNAQLEITSLLGEVVYNTTTHSSNGVILQDINLQNVAPGTYFVRIITADKVYNTKTMINR